MTTCFIDTETSGLTPYKHQVLTAAIKIVKPDSEPVTKEFQFGLLQSSLLDDKALAVNGLTRKQLESFPRCEESVEEFRSLLSKHCNPYDKADKMIFAGYNARFDYDMMRSMFDRLGDKYFGSWFWFPPVDIMNVAMIAIGENRPKLSDFKLSTVAKHLGIEVSSEGLHGALYDIELSIEVYNKCLTIIKEKP